MKVFFSGLIFGLKKDLQSFFLQFFFQKEFLRKQGQDLARQDARQDFADDLIFARNFVTACLAAGAPGASQHLAARDCMLDIMMLGTVDEEERNEEHDEQLSLLLLLLLSLSSSELVMEW